MRGAILANGWYCGYTFPVKLQIKVALIITGTLAFCSFFMSVYLVSGLLKEPLSESVMDADAKHFALFLPQNRNYYFTDILNGAQKSALDSGAALSVHTLDSDGGALRMAAYSGLDGVVVCPDLDDDIIFDSLMNLSRRRIPLVLVNHNIPADQPWPFVGTNNFDYGKKVGNLLINSGSSRINLVVVYSDKSPAIYAERELVEMGIHSVLSNRLESSITSFRTDLNPRDAEKIVYQLVRFQGAVNTIVFTDLNDTIAGTQALVDLNQVGRIQVVGFGNDPAIRHFIQKGIVAGSLVVNPYVMGYQAVNSLAQLAESGYTSTSVDTGIDVIHAENLSVSRPDRERRMP